MERYTSKQVNLRRTPKMVYETLANFNNFTPAVGNQLDEWQASTDACSFRIKGIPISLRIAEGRPNRLIRVRGDDSTPFRYELSVHIREAEPSGTRLRLVLHIEMNTVMKMLVGKRLGEGIDIAADAIAMVFNRSADVEVIRIGDE